MHVNLIKVVKFVLFNNIKTQLSKERYKNQIESYNKHKYQITS